MTAGIVFLVALVFVAGVLQSFGVFWFWFIVVSFAVMIIGAFAVDYWNGRPPGSGFVRLAMRLFGDNGFTRFLDKIFGSNQLERDQDKDDRYVLKKGYHH